MAKIAKTAAIPIANPVLLAAQELPKTSYRSQSRFSFNIHRQL
jgi:hypothetical protein